MTTDNKIELAQKSSKEMADMCQMFTEAMSKPKTWIKCEIDAQNKPYESVREEIEKICAEHEGKRELEITIKKITASED